jgi:hypothetical protein
MHYVHPQQTQIVGCVPIGVGLVAASRTGEALAPARTKAAAARANLARKVRLHDRDGNAGDVGLVLDEAPKLKETPARVVPADRFRNGRPATDAGQVLKTDPARILIASWTTCLLMVWFSVAWKRLSLPDSRFKIMRQRLRVDLVPFEAFFWRERRTR